MASSAEVPAKDGVTTSLSSLSINTAKPTKKSKKAVADSWEDEDVSDGDDAVADPSGSKQAVPSAPPPTPMDPSFHATQQQQQQQAWAAESESPARRPEKTDAVARRMIAAGLGLKAPKQTEEQKEYQKAIREQEKKKREQDKADEQRRREEAEKAKASVWDD